MCITRKGKNLYLKFKKKTKYNNPLEQTIYNLHNKDKVFLKYLKYKETYKIVKKVLSSGSYNNDCDIVIRQIAMKSNERSCATIA